MTLTLLLLVFILIAFISALTIIFKTVKKRDIFQPPLLTIYYHLHFIFYKLDFICNNFLFVTPRES